MLSSLSLVVNLICLVLTKVSRMSFSISIDECAFFFCWILHQLLLSLVLSLRQIGICFVKNTFSAHLILTFGWLATSVILFFSFLRSLVSLTWWETYKHIMFSMRIKIEDRFFFRWICFAYHYMSLLFLPLPLSKNRFYILYCSHVQPLVLFNDVYKAHMHMHTGKSSNVCLRWP